MPNREPMRVTLRDGQININGVSGLAFTQDGIEATRLEGYPQFRTDNNAELTATTTWRGNFDAAFNNLFWMAYNPYTGFNGFVNVAARKEPELDEKNEKLDCFLGEFIKEAV